MTSLMDILSHFRSLMNSRRRAGGVSRRIDEEGREGERGEGRVGGGGGGGGEEEGRGGYDERIAFCFQRSPTTRPGSHCSKHSVGKR